MKSLSKAEGQLMEIVWKKEKVFTKEILSSYKEPKPAVTTIATLLKRLQQKGFIGYILFGNSRQYYALIKKRDYFSKHLINMVSNYFNNSALQFASFFTTSTNLTADELKEIKKIVDREIKKKSK